MKRAILFLLIMALSGCNPFHERRQPLAKAVEGLDGLEPKQVRYCRCTGEREIEALPTHLWPEIKSRLLALAPAPEAVPGPGIFKVVSLSRSPTPLTSTSTSTLGPNASGIAFS